MEEEVETQCPYCGQGITLVVDTSIDEQTYIEDCEICCKPIQFEVHCTEGSFRSLEASRA